MARTILVGPAASVGTPSARTVQGAAAPAGARMRARRTKEYVEALTRLDAGGVVGVKERAEYLIEQVAREVEALGLPEMPLGLLARCYLGPPYEVHILDLAGSIVHHVKLGEPMPAAFERARALALHPAYAFIEVFPGSLQCVRADGSVVSA
jgi:hypothetical protein